MADHFDVQPVSRVTIGTVGEPGNRTFYLQATGSGRLYTLIIEKIQALALAQALDEMLEELENRFELPPLRRGRVPAADLELHEPLEPRFRVGQIGLGYDEESDHVVLMVAEMGVSEEPEEPEEDLATVRLWVSRDQAGDLATRASQVAGQGRPICPLCDQPIDPEGHFCPRSNGHGNH